MMSLSYLTARCAIGQFVPMEGAQPVIGSVGAEERVEEDRVEVLVNLGSPGQVNSEPVEMKSILAELKKVRMKYSAD